MINWCFFACWMVMMWVEPCHKPTMWEWFIPPIKMVMTGTWFMILPTLRDLSVASGRWTFCCIAFFYCFSQTRNVFLVTVKSIYVSNTLLLFNLVRGWHKWDIYLYIYIYHIDWAKKWSFPWDREAKRYV